MSRLMYNVRIHFNSNLAHFTGKAIKMFISNKCTMTNVVKIIKIIIENHAEIFKTWKRK